MGVVVEEPEELVLELREFLLAGETSVVLEVVVEQVDSFWLEKCSKLRVLVNDVPQVHFVEVGVNSAIANSGPEKHPRQDGKTFESESEVPELVEEDGE